MNELIIWQKVDSSKVNQIKDIKTVQFKTKLDLDDILDNSNGGYKQIDDVIDFQIIRCGDDNDWYLFDDCGYGNRNVYDIETVHKYYKKYLSELKLVEKEKLLKKQKKEEEKLLKKQKKEKKEEKQLNLFELM